MNKFDQEDESIIIQQRLERKLIRLQDELAAWSEEMLQLMDTKERLLQRASTPVVNELIRQIEQFEREFERTSKQMKKLIAEHANYLPRSTDLRFH